MTSPPAHLLPLALEAMTSADACEVLGDALLECGWCDWRIGYVASGHSEPPDNSPWWMQNCARWVLRWLNRYPREIDSLRRARAIAAVLLFGEWSTARWPLVEAHEALSSRPFLAHIERLKGMLDDNVITVDQFRELLNMPMRTAGVRE